MVLAAQYFPAPASEAPPVLLLHGFASSADEGFLSTGWPESLRAAGRSAIAIDLPGHGASPGVSSAGEAATSEVVSAILDAVAGVAPEGQIDVVGYSLGSRLAWELPAASPRIRRLVLGGISPFEPFSMVDPEALAAALAGGEPANPVVGIMAQMISAPGRDTASLAHVIAGLASEPFTPSNGAPQVPTLFVAGADDDMTQGIDSLVEATPEGSLTRVPGDHRGALDSPEFRAAAIEFLA